MGQRYVTMAIMLIAVAPALAQPAKTIHVLGPNNNYAYQFDPMICEAAARLVTAELVVRYAQAAKFYPVDSQVDLPQDAWPRITFTAQEYAAPPHFRLRRQGNAFYFFASHDGKDYTLFARLTTPFKTDLHVGIMLAADWKGRQDGSATFSNVRLNGKEVADFQQVNIGQCYKESSFRHEADKWICQQSGYDYQGWDVREHGQFLYQSVKGDFEIEATVGDFSTPNPSFNACILCREGLDLDSASLGIFSCGKRFDGNWRMEKTARGLTMRDPGMHLVAVYLQKLAKDEPALLCRIPVSQPCWEGLRTSATTLADAVISGLVKELNLDLSKPASAAPPDEKTLSSLQDALQQAALLNSSKMLDASRKIDELLSKSPLLPDNHYAVAMLGSIMASQDLTGVFSERGRFLGGLLSHQLLAGRLGKEPGNPGKLSEAWLAMASGYPKAALEIYKQMPLDWQKRPEMAALKLFVDRDYRVLDEESVTDAAPLVQLAWLHAVQECNRERLLGRIPARLSRDAQSPALLPLHVISPDAPLAARSAFGHDAYNLLHSGQIPLKDRSKAAEAFADALDISKGDIYAVAENIYSLMTSEDSTVEMDEKFYKPLCELYLLAMRCPVGPQKLSTGELRWNGISLHDYADLQRGLLLRTFFYRGKENYDNEDRYLQAARTFAGIPGAADFFELLSLLEHQRPQAKEKLAAFLKTRPARSAALMRWLWVRNGSTLDLPLTLPAGRGSWDWESLSWISLYKNINATSSYVLAALENDFCCEHAIETLAFMCKDPAVAKPYLDMMPYNTRLLSDVAYQASELGKDEIALEAYKKLAEIDEQVQHYQNLAISYYRLKKLDEALEVVKKAESKLPNDIDRQKLQAKAVHWLIRAGRLDEALEMGKKAMEGYCQEGMEAYAAAYDANETIDEALAIYKQVSEMYPETCSSFFRFLVKRAYEQGYVLDEITLVLVKNEKVAHVIKDNVLWGFRDAGGNAALLEKVLAGPLSSLDETIKARQLLINAMLQRDFPKAVEYSQRLRKAGSADVEETIWSAVAYRLAGKELPEAVRSLLEKCPQKHDLLNCAKYCLGQTPASSLPTKAHKRSIEVYSLWLRGVEAELQHDTDDALDNYQKACERRGFVEPDGFCRFWAIALENPRPQASQPGSSAAKDH